MAEPKSPQHWESKGYQFSSLTNCPACGEPVESWTKNFSLYYLDKDTLEPHFSSCKRAQEYRNELRLKEGIL